MDREVTIVVVDDEAPIRELLRHCFEAESYTVLEASNGAELFAILDSNTVDLVTLDLSLGGENGLDLARDIHAHSDIGIIMVTGRGELIDTVLGLEVGADDYISKPFQLREVLARTRSVLRRRRQQPVADESPSIVATTGEPQFGFGEWTLSPATRGLQDAEGNTCSLTTAEFELLEIFVNNPQHVMSRDQIMEQMRGHDWVPTDRTIDNHVARLRKKIERNSIQFIKTVRGVGYLFTAEVTRS